jgi:cobalt transporter subunit CbtB
MENVHELQHSLQDSGARVWTMTGRWPAIGLLLFGSVILYFVGFSNLPQAHNAAHDARHASGFPCH